MKKLISLLLLPVFLTPTMIVSTDIDTAFEPKDLVAITDGVATSLLFYHTIPSHPILLTETLAYQSEALDGSSILLSTETDLSIVALTLNDQGLPVFELDNGYFILASRQVIYDDVILEQNDYHETFWTLDGIVTYTSPIVKGTVLSERSVEPFEKVVTRHKAVTRSGIFFEIEGYGWVPEQFLSMNDTRMQKVQKLLTEKYNSDQLSVYVKSLKTDQVAELNPEKSVYAASVTKLATLYYAQDQVSKGKYHLDSPLLYSQNVLDFHGAYETEGSGQISKVADDKEYRLDQLLQAIAKESDNAASNIVAYYLTNQFDSSFTKKITSITGQPWDMSNREANVRMAGRLMEAIYKQDGQILDYLSETSFDHERIARDIPVPVAHKIGDAYDFRHDVAIVYTDEPFILAIFTEHMTYDDISTIAKDIYTILK